MRRRYKIAAVALGLSAAVAGIALYQGLGPWLPRIVISSDLILSGSDVVRYDAVQIELYGNISVRDDAQLRISHSRILVRESYDQQFTLEVRGHGILSISDTTVETNGKWYNGNYYADSTVTLTRVRAPIWQSVSGNSSLTVDDAPASVTLLPYGHSTVDVRNATEASFELAFVSQNDVDVSLPIGPVAEWSSAFPSVAAPYTIHVTNSILSNWAVDVSPFQNLTVRDSPRIGVGWVLGSGSGGPIDLAGLRSGHYDDVRFSADGSSIRLVNTTVERWWPTAFAAANVTIRDSYLADIRFYDDATASVRNSTMTLVAAYGRARVRVYDSMIEYSVTATDDAVIEMFQTTFHGQVLALGRAQIFSDGRLLPNGNY